MAYAIEVKYFSMTDKTNSYLKATAGDGENRVSLKVPYDHKSPYPDRDAAQALINKHFPELKITGVGVLPNKNVVVTTAPDDQYYLKNRTELHKAIPIEAADAIEKMIIKILSDGHKINVFDEEDVLKHGCTNKNEILDEMGASDENTLQIDVLGSFLFLWVKAEGTEEVISDYSDNPESESKMEEYYRIVAG